MKFTPISPFVGVECHEPLSFPLSVADSATIRDAVHRHSMVVFRNQSIGDDEQIALAETMGDVGLEPPSSYIVGHTKLSTFEHRQQADYGSAGSFHCDGMFDVPISGLCLRVIEHPTAGGDLAYCSFKSVWESLTPGVRQFFKGLTVRYSALPPVAARKYIRTNGKPPVDIPLVFRHPVTGEESLWFSPMGARDIPELSQEEVPLVFSLLNNKINQFRHQIRVRYTPGTVILLDNTAGCHAVAIDYLPEVRRASRVVIRGKPLERAAPAFGSWFSAEFVTK